jgi:hypothetical protein
MHEPVLENLEAILRTSSDRRVPAQVEAHLAACAPCRVEVDAMLGHCDILRSLRAPEEGEPAAGFYARVMARVEEQGGGTASIWSIFLAPFGKRLALASATLLVLLGTYMYTSESGMVSTEPEPEAVLIQPRQQDIRQVVFTEGNQQQDRDALLVNLATYSSDSYQ